MVIENRTAVQTWNIRPVGDQAVLVVLGSCIDEEINRRVMALTARIREAGLPGFVECVPSFTSLMIVYDPLLTEYDLLRQQVEQVLGNASEAERESGRRIEIPVCYGGVYGEDLPFVAEHAGLTEEEVIRIHSGRDYRVYMLGFLPGFPYLGGLDQRIFTPRLLNPRTKIPAGSVGIGGEQTGIYPMDSPGGWQLIGRTPWKLYDPTADGGGIRYDAGDIIRFVPVSEAEYKQLCGS